jgi:glycerophosphoryl diester phosphodiesterase
MTHPTGGQKIPSRRFAQPSQAGYGIELDVQMSSDGAAMVFHDNHLDRLTDQIGPIAQRPAADLSGIKLSGGHDTIADLKQVLDLIAGRVPLLVEIKDQDGNMGQDVGPLEAAVATALRPYRGPVAVMSFNPHSVSTFGEIRADIPLGLVTDRFEPEDWPGLNADRREHLGQILDFGASGAGFYFSQSNTIRRSSCERAQSTRGSRALLDRQITR